MSNGFFLNDISKGNGVLKGKTLASLANAKSNRNALIALFGGVEWLPSSVMRAKRARPKISFDAPAHERSYGATCKLEKLDASKRSRMPEMLQDAYYISGRGCGAGALSTFWQEIGRSMVLLYSEPGDTIFDPFAGHNSRMDLCVHAGRHYIGCDLSTNFMQFNKQRAKQLREKFPTTKIKLHHCDSRRCPVDDEIGDMTITSPPYFDIEEYGDEPEQLGKSKTYKEFLRGLGKVIRENFRVLKPGAYAAWFVNDFRRNGKMHFYHIDTIRLARKAGFIAHDIMIVDLGHGIRDCFTNQVIEQKLLPKRHEYGLVFRKPPVDSD